RCQSNGAVRAPSAVGRSTLGDHLKEVDIGFKGPHTGELSGAIEAGVFCLHAVGGDGHLELVRRFIANLSECAGPAARDGGAWGQRSLFAFRLSDWWRSLLPWWRSLLRVRRRRKLCSGRCNRSHHQNERGGAVAKLFGHVVLPRGKDGIAGMLTHAIALERGA